MLEDELLGGLVYGGRLAQYGGVHYIKVVEGLLHRARRRADVLAIIR